MASHKMLTKTILTTLGIALLVLPKTVSAVGASINTTLNKTYYRPQIQVSFTGGTTTGPAIGAICDFNQDNYQNCSINRIVFYDSNGNHILTEAGKYYQINLSWRLDSGSYTGSFNDFTNPLYELIDVEYNNSGDNNLGVNQAKVLIKAKTTGDWLEFGGNFVVFWSGFYKQLDNQLFFNVGDIVVLSEVDNSSESEVADKELEGQDNIENQDTSGNNQGVQEDDYSSLLDIFTGFISAITNVKATNCSISLNTGMGNFGNVDLCEIEPPSYIQIVGSLIVILLFVPCSMALIKRILRTIQELQQ